MRIGIAALHHETNSFSNIPMNWEYLRRTRFEKETYRNVYTPRRNYSGGFIAKGKELGIEIVPAASAYLCPSGHITDEALEKHRDGLVALLWQAHQEQAMDDGFFRTVGLRHDLLRYAGVKSSQHFKGWWKDYCSGIVPCDSPGIHCADLRVFDFKFTNTGYFPLGDPQWNGE